MKHSEVFQNPTFFFFLWYMKGMWCSSEKFFPAVEPLLYLGLFQGKKKYTV